MYDPKVLQLIFELTGIPITLYDPDWKEIQSFTPDQTGADPSRLSLLTNIKQRLKTESFCFVPFTDTLPLGICGFRKDSQFCILGPFSYGKTNSLEYRNFMRSHQLTDCPPCQPETLHSIVRFLTDGNEVQSEFFADYHDWITRESLRQYDFFQKNHTYQEEKQLYDHVRNGDVSYMKNWILADLPSHPVLMDNLFKNEEYMAVIGISMAARAAIEGGLSSAEGFLHNDILLKKLASCRTIPEIKKVQHEGMVHLAEQVAKIQKQNSSNLHVEKCKKRILSKRFEEISISGLADELGISSEYLQKLFKKYEGISIRKYIQQVKMEMACNLLKYSDRQIQEIAQYLHYSNVSHFSTAFRKYMQISPREYREQNQHPQF